MEQKLKAHHSNSRVIQSKSACIRICGSLISSGSITLDSIDSGFKSPYGRTNRLPDPCSVSPDVTNSKRPKVNKKLRKAQNIFK